MRFLIQNVQKASVYVENEAIGEMEKSKKVLLSLLALIMMTTFRLPIK